MTSSIQSPALESAAEFQIQAVLNTFLRQRCDERQLVSQLTAACRQDNNATWHALSLLDQLQRRALLSTELFRAIKQELNEIVFSTTGTYVAIPAAGSSAGPTLRAVVSGRASANAQTRLPEPANAKLFQPLRPGALLNNRYLIVEPLTAGSASMTFKALDRQREALPNTDRYVAIRWLDEHLQRDPHAIVAMQNEFAQLQAIAHPAIPKVYELSDAFGACSIVMELPDGDVLSRINERITPRRLPLSHALTVVREIGFALVNAHANGVVHGSLHMGSVVITRSGELRVYDFAQADSWAELSALSADSNLNSVPAVMRRYCSPQRLKSMTARVGDDLYSLACIAYELLCARPLNVELLRGNDWQQPTYAKHLSARQWRALQRGLDDSPVERGNDVRSWLAELGLDQAAIRLPALANIEAEFVPAVHDSHYKLLRWF